MAQERWNGERGDVMSRRMLMTKIGLAAGAAVVAPRIARRAAGPMAPPSTVTTPPRDFGPNGAPTTYFTDPDVLSVDPLFNGSAQPNSADPAAVDRRALVGGAGVERPGALSGLERHPQQPAAAMARGRRPRERVPHAVEQQQRQHVRLPGPPALLRAPDAARRALRARRLDHHPRGRLRGQAPQLAERRRAASGRQLLVHRPALRRAALRGRAGRGGRAEQPGGPAQAAWARRRRSAARSASCRPTVYRIDPSGNVDLVVTEEQVPDPNGLCFSPDYKKLYVVSTGKGPGDTGPGGKGDIYVFDVGSRQQALQPEALLRLHGRRRQVRAGRPALRRRRQRVGSSNAGPHRRLQRRPRLDAGGQADRPHPAAGDLRQRLLRRAEAEPPVHGGSQSLYAVYVNTQGAAPG